MAGNRQVPSAATRKAGVMKLRVDKSCHRHDHANLITTYCRFGYCVILRCPWCMLETGGWGPVACPHMKGENGTLRWYKYPDMDKKKTHWGKKGDRRR
jgi:hypothetical protein